MNLQQGNPSTQSTWPIFHSKPLLIAACCLLLPPTQWLVHQGELRCKLAGAARTVKGWLLTQAISTSHAMDGLPASMLMSMLHVPTAHRRLPRRSACVRSPPSPLRVVPPAGRRRVRCAVLCGSMPKAVIFDLGKVLLDFDFHRSSRRLSEACTAPSRTKQVLPPRVDPAGSFHRGSRAPAIGRRH